MGLIALAACSPRENPLTPAAAVVAEEARYRITFESSSPETPDDAGRLRVRVQMQGVWKVVPEAPAWLQLEAGPGIDLVPPRKREPDATRTTERLEFSHEYRATHAREAVARGHLKFGICKGERDHCVIIERDIVLPLETAFASNP